MVGFQGDGVSLKAAPFFPLKIYASFDFVLAAAHYTLDTSKAGANAYLTYGFRNFIFQNSGLCKTSQLM